MISKPALNRIVKVIHAEPELNGCAIGYCGSGKTQVLHRGNTPSVNYGRICVIVEEAMLADKAFSLNESAAAKNGSSSQPAPVTNRSRLGRELFGAGLSCGMTIVAGVGVLGSAAAEVPTVGGSSVVLVLAWTGFVTSGLQCVNGAVRVRELLANPDDNSLERWDKVWWYEDGMLAIDAIGIGAGVAALPAATKNLLAVLERRGGLKAAKEFLEMSKAEQKAAAKKALEQASKTPEGRKALEEALAKSGLKPKQIEGAFKFGTDSRKRWRIVANAVSKETARRLHSNILGIAGTTGGISASASPSEYTGSASGIVNKGLNVGSSWIVHILKPENSKK